MHAFEDAGDLRNLCYAWSNVGYAHMRLGLLEDALAPLFTPEKADAKANAARTLWAGLHGICSLSGSGKLQVVSTQTVRAMAEGLVANYVAGLRIRQEGS